MYNEVFKTCPKCGHLAYAQISQIVLGFGGFNLENPERIAEELTENEIIQLVACVKDTWFECHDCGNTFKLNEKKNTNDKTDLLKKLLNEDEQ